MGQLDRAGKTKRAVLHGAIGLVSVAVSLLLEPAVAAQSPSTAARRPAFEVASIKPNKSGDLTRLMAPQPGGRFIATNVTLSALIWRAYSLQGSQLAGGPSWLDSDRFDITAKATGNPSPNEILSMLRTLLEDRFKLTFHHESRELPVYALVVDKKGRLGSRLRPSDGKCAAAAKDYMPRAHDPNSPPPCGDFRMGAAGLTARGMTMVQVANLLAGRVDRVGLDRTALAGAFDVDLEFSPDSLPPIGPPGARAGADPVASDPSVPSFFTAIREQLGLRLESTKGPVEVLVVDRAERPAVE